MKLKSLHLLLLLLLFPLLAFPQGKPSKIYKGVGPEVPLKTNAVIREYKTEIDIKSRNRIIIREELVITILDDDGKDYGVADWYYDNDSKIISGSVWVYDTTGNILEKKRLSELSDFAYTRGNFYDDYRLKYYAPLIKKTPYTFHYKFTKEVKEFFNIPSWYPQFGRDIYIEKASLKINNPAHLIYRYYENSFPDSSLVFTENDYYKEWKVTDIPPLDVEKYGPSVSDQLPHIYLPLESFEMEEYLGNFYSWESFGQWAYHLNKGRQELPPTTISYIKKMTDTIEGEKAKAERIYNWMQEQTRYVSIQLGIGGYQPFTALEVDEKKYGDCKALSNYTQALLAVADIDSYYSFVEAGRDNLPLDKDVLVDPFNHAILCIPFDGDTTWLECTSDRTPFGYLGSFTNNRYALLIKDGESQLVKTTSYNMDDNLLQRKSQVKITTEGGLEAGFQAEYHNLQIGKRQFQFEEALPDQIDNLYELWNINGLKIDGLHYQFEETAKPIIYEKVDFRVRKMATTTSSKIFFPLYYLNKKQKKVKKDANRINDILLREPFTQIDTIIYDIPEGYSISSLPKPKEITSDFGSYRSTITMQGEQILFVRKQLQFQGVFPPSKFEEFRKYKNSTIKADKATVVLEKL